MYGLHCYPVSIPVFIGKAFHLCFGHVEGYLSLERPLLTVLSPNYEFHHSFCILDCDIIAEEPYGFCIVLHATFGLRSI